MLKENINSDDAIEAFRLYCRNDNRYLDNIDESLLTVEEFFKPYYFFDFMIYNQNYFIKNEGLSYEGRLDISYTYSDSDFILNELSKNDAFVIQDEPNNLLYNNEEKIRRKCIEEVKKKGIEQIKRRHKIYKNSAFIDLYLINQIDFQNEEIFYEKVYQFRYRTKERKKDYVSILSSNKNVFYSFESQITIEYQEFLRKYKRPIAYIPNEFIDSYYKESFRVYEQVNENLKYQSSDEIYRKMKKNIKNKEYSKYNEYLNIGIFYYKRKDYLFKYEYESKNLKDRVTYSYLTLKHQDKSGLFLYECCNLGIIKKKNPIVFLLDSYRLGNLQAKKLLYEYYSLNFPENDKRKKRFS